MRKIIIAFLLLTAAYGFAQNQPVFNNMRTFTANSTLQLPKGTTRIMAEVWGAGGGGTVVGGGGGGAYGKVFIDVSEGTNILVEVGQGGTGHLTNANSGQSSGIGLKTASGSSILFRVQGGTGSETSFNTAGGATGGKKADAANASIGYVFIPGEDGELYVDNSHQSGNAQVITRNYGDGGNAGNTLYTGGRGAVAVTTSGTVSGIRTGTDGKMPGGGGGAGTGTKGYNGGNGMVIIYY